MVSRRSLRRPWFAGRFRRIALIVGVATALSAASAATLLYTQHATQAAPGVGCDIPSNQQSKSCSYNGLSATALFDTFSPDGCVETSVYVIASDGMTRNPSFSIVKGTGAEVDIFQYDSCNYVQLVEAFGMANDVNFSEDNKLDSATLSATVTVTDFAQVDATPYPVTVNLTWQGVGATDKTDNTTHDKFGVWIINGHFHGDSRSATVSGSITDGVTDYGALPVSSAMMLNANGGFEFINHG